MRQRARRVHKNTHTHKPKENEQHYDEKMKMWRKQPRKTQTFPQRKMLNSMLRFVWILLIEQVENLRKIALTFNSH